LTAVKISGAAEIAATTAATRAGEIPVALMPTLRMRT
jgi:hypothetical protein